MGKRKKLRKGRLRRDLSGPGGLNAVDTRRWIAFKKRRLHGVSQIDEDIIRKLFLEFTSKCLGASNEPVNKRNRSLREKKAVWTESSKKPKMITVERNTGTPSTSSKLQRSRKRKERYFRIAVDLFVIGVRRSHRNVTFDFSKEVPSNIRDEIRDLGFDQWCEKHGLDYQMVANAAANVNANDVLRYGVGNREAKPHRKSDTAQKKPGTGKARRPVSLVGAVPLAQSTGSQSNVDRVLFQDHTRILFQEYAQELISEISRKSSSVLKSYVARSGVRINYIKSNLEHFRTQNIWTSDVSFDSVSRAISVVLAEQKRNFDSCSEELSYFKWPTIEIQLWASEGKKQSGVEATVNFLSSFGYKVGRSGLRSAKERWLILEKVLSTKIDLNDAFFSNVGSPNSCARLKRISYAIAFCVRNARRQRKDYSVAIDDWKSDLSYLKEKHYLGRCDGSWVWRDS